MKISERFNLNKTQHELDFVDIDPSSDLTLFIDPYYLSTNIDQWSLEATDIIHDFFQYFIDLVIRDKLSEAEELLYHLTEPNETCLGLSQSEPKGRGVGKMEAKLLFKSLLTSDAIKTGMVSDLEDCKIFIKGIAKDKTSDMVTNIIRKHLISYTQTQCNLWKIPLTEGVPTGFYWNRIERRWENSYTSILIIENKPILLVPKARVSFIDEYTPTKYYRHFVLNFLKHEHLRMNSVLVQRRKNGDKFVTKKDLEKESPYTKEFLKEFTKKHPEVFQEFKNKTKNILNPIKNEFLQEINIDELIDYLIGELQNIPSGEENASKYHKLIVGILEFLFYPDLINPQKEREIHDGKKRIDITFDNAAKTGFYNKLHEIHKIYCPYIFIECKNYSNDPNNPELDQLSGRFSKSRGWFGFLLCRNINDMDLFMKRCKNTYIDGRGTIIPIVDKDLVLILNEIKSRNYNQLQSILETRLRDVVLN